MIGRMMKITSRESEFDLSRCTVVLELRLDSSLVRCSQCNLQQGEVLYVQLISVNQK